MNARRFAAGRVCRKCASRTLPALALCLLSLATGCRQVDFDQMRRQHAEQFPVDLRVETLRRLPDGSGIGLQECIDLALENNLEVLTADVNRRLATLDRQIAFSRFLPHIEISVSHRSADRQQAIGVGGFFTPMADRAITTAVLSAQQDIFAPESWFLYSAYAKGEAVGDLVARHTRNLIRLQVTTLYFSCLSREHARAALESALEQLRTLLRETEALARENLATTSQVEEVRALLIGQQAGLARIERALADGRAALLEVMGLDPTADVVLDEEAPPPLEDRELAEQVLTSLLQRPELRIADQTIEIRKDETRIAIAQFLPRFMGFSDLTNSSNSFLKYENIWTVGASGVLTVFDGFANVRAYQAAREREKQAAIDREQACMTIMLEVIRARSQHEQAKDDLEVAMQEVTAAEMVLNEAQAKWREGLLVSSARLDAVTRTASALANASSARFRAQVTAATLLHVMGYPHEGSERE